TVAEHTAADPVASLVAPEAIKTALRNALRSHPGERTQTTRQLCAELSAALSTGQSADDPEDRSRGEATANADASPSPADGWRLFLTFVVSVTGITGGLAFLLYVIRELGKRRDAVASGREGARPERPPRLP